MVVRDDLARAIGRHHNPEQLDLMSAPAEDERVNKTIRIRTNLEKKVKQEAWRRTLGDGHRVTESDIIDEALEQYLSGKQ